MADSQGSSGQTGGALGTNTSGTTSSGVWNYDDTTGLYLNPITGAYSYSDPSAGASSPYTTLQNPYAASNTSSGVWNYDDTTGLYLNPLTGAYSYSDPSGGSSGQTGSALGTNTLGANTSGVNTSGVNT